LREGERETTQRVFIQLVQPGEGTEDTRKLATSEEVGGDNWDLVTRLADKRLVVTNRDESTNTVEVVHEALIRHWGRLRGWMQENRKFRIWQQGLMVALQQWVDSSKDDGALLRGATLAVAEDWLQQRGGEVSKPQRSFIEKSVELRERERKQKERLRRSVIGGLAAGLVLALSLAGFTGWQWREARIREINAQFNADSLSMEALLASNLELDALLEAVKTGKKLQQYSPDVEVDTRMRVIAALRQIIYGVKERNRLRGNSYWVTSISFSKNGTIISSAGNGIIQIWSKEGKELRKIQVIRDKVYHLTASPDGNTIASGNLASVQTAILLPLLVMTKSSCGISRVGN
jgi:WD40 repeat protein